MSVTVDVRYLGDLRCEATHGPSGSTITTDAPLDNRGRGELFSPTDLVGTALLTCMITIMGMAAADRGIDMRGTRGRVTKEMIADPKRRIARLALEIHVPGEHDERARRVLEAAAHSCPVHHSLDGRVEVDLRFRWGA